MFSVYSGRHTPPQISPTTERSDRAILAETRAIQQGILGSTPNAIALPTNMGTEPPMFRHTKNKTVSIRPSNPCWDAADSDSAGQGKAHNTRRLSALTGAGANGPWLQCTAVYSLAFDFCLVLACLSQWAPHAKLAAPSFSYALGFSSPFVLAYWYQKLNGR